ncbi:creatininase family protein [Actinokineospora fastidiosa]|uniref:creatininase family protein n=1 Tax=Actinokineospora fastidiosa TaxID=1816 RepID=UPI0016710CC5|nr:creatininase family protein [Actinokineospora fastidiosa]
MITMATSVDEATRGAEVAVLPVGSFEQHGGHLPLATDTLVACAIAGRIAERHGLFCLPPITISCSHEHEGYPGTVSIGAGTLIAMIGDIRASLSRSGIDRLVMVNGHGGNYVLSNIAQEANVTGRKVALFPGRDDIAKAREDAGMATCASEDMHGGEWETSILLHTHPDAVGDGRADADHEATARPYLHLLGMKGYTESGVIGRPSLGSAEKGRAAVESLTESFACLLGLLRE